MPSSRPKSSLPVTGNLAIEIFFGACLPGFLRVIGCGVTSCELRRVLLRPATMASALVGTAFNNSVGF
jgi:hypothetical protein